MEPLHPHVVRISDDLWGLSHKGHPVAWCDSHVPSTEWDFHLEMDMDDPHAEESYVFSFTDQNMAIQFALLYG